MIGILDQEREEQRRARIEKKLKKQNRSQYDDKQKKLQFLDKFCNVVRDFEWKELKKVDIDRILSPT